jgi:hypothetical protein
MVVTGTLSVSGAAVATSVIAHTLRVDERAGLIDPQLGEATRNLAAIDTTIEMYKERITR